MSYFHLLEIAGHWAAIGTALVAFFAPAVYLFDLWRKRQKLEKYLREELKGKTPSHSILHLVARLGMTEGEVIQASFRSHHIVRLLAVTGPGPLASHILLKYSP